MDPRSSPDATRLTRRGVLGLAALGATAAAASTRWISPWPALARAAALPPAFTELRVGASDLRSRGRARSATALVESRVVRAPWRFDLVGVRLDDEAAGRVEVRARRTGGPWSRWVALARGGDHAPDGARRRASEPVWVGGRDELQLRMAGAARPVRLCLVAAGHPRGPIVARAAAAPAGGPPIVPRSAWGGDRVAPRATPSYGQVQLAFVHHTVTANDYRPQDSAGMVLAIARYHRDANGWDDIGYNFLVDRFGQIFEGRAGGIEEAVVGAQAQGYNASSTGVALLGSHEGRAASPEAIAALGSLVGWKLARHGAPATGAVQVVSAGGPLNRFSKGRPVTFQRVAGHRDGDRTACPGAALYGQLPQIRSLAAEAAAGVPARTSSEPVALSARTHTGRVRARGRGALVRGSATHDGPPARIAVSRKVRGRWRWVRNVPISPRAAGEYSVRIRLPTPGLYRLVAAAGDERAAPLLVRSIRG